MGGLLGYLLNQYGSPGGVNLGVDMSKAAGIAPRSTTLAPSRYVSYSDYGARDSNAGMSPQLAHSFGVPTGLGSANLPPVSAYTAVPARQSLPSRTIKSAGSGTGVLQNPYVTARSNNTISPLTGALMGSAIGYLMPTSTTTGTTGSTGGTGSSGVSSGVNTALGNLLGAVVKKYGTASDPIKAPPVEAGGRPTDVQAGTTSNGSTIITDELGQQWNIDSHGNATLLYDPKTGTGTSMDEYAPSASTDLNNFGGTNPSYTTGANTGGSTIFSNPTYPVNNTSVNDNSNVLPDNGYSMANGGMATPMMADGGQVPSYYTYGTAIDPQQIMQNMAKGGQPQGGLHVPTVEGRHDYRQGSRVTGEGDGQSDDIPAMLADGEYVFDADTVAQLGNGSTKAGSDLLDRFREEIRSHKRSAPVNKIPPPAKSPLAYLKAARSKKNG
jgi:hypothetical protein